MWLPTSTKVGPAFGGCGVLHRSPMALTPIARRPSEAVEYITTASEGRRTGHRHRCFFLRQNFALLP